MTEEQRKSRSWLFTINFDTKELDEEDTPSRWLEYKDSKIVYLCYQLEQEACLHYQGYCYFKNDKSLKTLKTYDQRANFRIADGTPQENRTYCSKKDDTTIPGTFEEFGIIPLHGHRNDLDAFYAAIKDGASLYTLCIDFTAQMMRYGKSALFIKTTIEDYEGKESYKKRALAKNIQLLPWQQDVITLLDAQNERHILWIWDSSNSGKSRYIGEWLECNREVYSVGVSEAKITDLIHDYAGEPYAHFDFPKDTKYEQIPFKLFENLKNGKVFSPKYQSHKKYFKTCPKILITSNIRIIGTDIKTYGEDRYQVYEGIPYTKDEAKTYRLIGSTTTTVYTGPTIASTQTHTPFGFSNGPTANFDELMEE